MKRLSKAECVSVAIVAVVAILISWFVITSNRGEATEPTPESEVIFSADTMKLAKKDTVKKENKKGKRENSKKKTKKNTAVNSVHVERNFLEEKLPTVYGKNNDIRYGEKDSCR